MRKLATIALAAATLAACGRESVEQWPPAKIYTIRGEVTSLPPPDRAPEWLGIRHEAIPDFIDITGESETMHSMTMEFTVDESVDLSTVAVGDKIAFRLEIDWSADAPARVIELEPLPPETELDFGGRD